MVLYAIRNKDTGKLVSNCTRPRKKFWERKSHAGAALNKAYNKERLELVQLQVVECAVDENCQKSSSR